MVNYDINVKFKYQDWNGLCYSVKIWFKNPLTDKLMNYSINSKSKESELMFLKRIMEYVDSDKLKQDIILYTTHNAREFNNQLTANDLITKLNSLNIKVNVDL